MLVAFSSGGVSGDPPTQLRPSGNNALEHLDLLQLEIFYGHSTGTFTGLWTNDRVVLRETTTAWEIKNIDSRLSDR